MKRNRNNTPVINPDKSIVFFDFDNTVTTHDVFDDMVMRFSEDEQWINLEKRWRAGEIGSKECLEGQLKGVRITKKALDEHLSGIKLDPYFKRLLDFLDARRIKKIILSDNFDYVLKRILSLHALNKVKIYSNKLLFSRGRIIPRFPFTSRNCKVCAHCKTRNLLENSGKDSIIFYIGDGNSDICPAEYADIVFAKKDLLKYCKNNKLNFHRYSSLRDVYDYFKRSSYEW